MVRALLVEDNASFRRSFKRILCVRFPCMDVEESTGGEEALQRVDTLRPNLIFMDIKLPGKNGLELTKKIKTNYPSIIVVILTSCDLPEYRQAAYQNGANYFVSKSFSTSEEILALVESILSGTGFASKYLAEKARRPVF
ncbi:MAG: response regulator [candidate division Zixibacteria bacterium]|nr:response regulator [candidate division Zixibacteria bacterium]